MIDTEVTTETAQRTGPLLSRLGLCTLYVIFAYSHLVAMQQDGFRLSLLLLVVFETTMVGLVFVRRDSTKVDFTTTAVVAGLVGSFAALGFRPTGGGEDLIVGQAVQLVGIVFQLGASVSLGRSFGLVPANRGIKTGGLYRLVRHPFYFSYLVTQTGYIINNPSTRNVVVLAIGLGFQVVRIRYEERLLMGDADYVAYARSVKWHLVPRVW